MRNTKEIHSDALDLLARINNEIPDLERVDTLNCMMKSVIRELDIQIVDDIINKNPGK